MGIPHAVNKLALQARLTQVYLNSVQNSKTNKPAELQAQELAAELSNAIADFVQNIMVQVNVTIPPALIAPPGTISTAGSPAAQVSVTPVPMSPVPLPPTFGSVL